MNGSYLLSIGALVCVSAMPSSWAQPRPPRELRVGGPVVVAQPESQTVTAGSSATFTVTVADNVPVHYQWSFNGLPVGPDSSTYTRSGCTLADDGGFVRVTVSSQSGSCRSRTVALTVNPIGTVYYVAPDGSTANTGLSAGSPWPVSRALARLGPGITLTLLPGTYPGPIVVNNVSGTAERPMVIRSQIKWKAVIADSKEEGLRNDGTVDYLIVDGLCVRGGALGGIALGRNSTVKNCWVVSNVLSGIYFCSPPDANNIVENNLVECNGWSDPAARPHHGIYISGPNNIVRGNVVRRNSGYGIHVYNAYPGVWNHDNSIYQNLTYGHTNFYGMTVWGGNGNDGSNPGTNYIYNNTILDGLDLNYGGAGVTNNIILASSANPTLPIRNSSARPVSIRADYNLSMTALAPAGAHDVRAAPGLVDPDHGLAWLTAGSAARAKACRDLVAPVDFFRNAQSSLTDIGAFQYSPILAADTRVLDPSGGVADYWCLP